MRLINLAEYELHAKKYTTPASWNFIASGSEDESTLIFNRMAFSKWVFRPRVLSGSASVDLCVSLFGQTFSSPILVAPMGYHGLIHKDAELATVRGANAAKAQMIVSTMSNYSLETIASEASEPIWFQIYCMKDRELTSSLIRRAEDSGYSALVVTVDTPRLGRRERQVVNEKDSSIGSLSPANLPKDIIQKLGELSFSDMVEQLFDSMIDWNAVSWLMKQTKLPVMLKGILTAEDAKQAVRLGVDGIIVSNHGGRQLDGASASLDALPEIVEAVDGRCSILFDGGIRRGTDILKARALGADAVLIGRPILWGLACNGADGVADVLNLLKNELEHAMVLSGQSSWRLVDRSLIAENQLFSYGNCHHCLRREILSG